MLLKEVLGVCIDLGNLLFQSLLFILPHFSFFGPHHSLLVSIGLLVFQLLLSFLLLLCEFVAHGFGGSLLDFGLSIFVFSRLQLTFPLILSDHLVLLLLSLIHLFKHTVSHAIHELLLSLLPSLPFSFSIGLLLVKHAGILFLHSNIFEALLLSFLLLDFLVFSILGKHFHKVLLFLTLLIGSYLFLCVHLILQSFHHRYFLLEVLFGLFLALNLILYHLGLSHLLLLSDFSGNGRLLVFLLLIEQFQVLLLELEVLSSLLPLFLLLLFLSPALFV